MEAAVQALQARFLSDEALRLLDVARDLAASEPPSEHASLILLTLDVLKTQGRSSQGEGLVSRLVAIAREIGDAPLELESRVRQAEYQLHAGELAASSQSLEALLSSELAVSPAWQVRVQHLLGLARLHQGDVSAAREAFEFVASAAPREGLDETGLRASGNLAYIAGEEGDLQASVVGLTELARAADEAENLALAGDAWLHLGARLDHVGRRDESRVALSRAVDVARKIGDRGLEALSVGNLGAQEFNAGNLGSSIRRFREAELAWLELGDERQLRGVRANIALYLGLIGETGSARDVIHALASEQREDAGFHLSTCLRHGAEIERLDGNPDRAFALAQEALDVAAEAEERIRCRIELARSASPAEESIRLLDLAIDEARSVGAYPSQAAAVCLRLAFDPSGVEEATQLWNQYGETLSTQSCVTSALELWKVTGELRFLDAAGEALGVMLESLDAEQRQTAREGNPEWREVAEAYEAAGGTLPGGAT